MKRVIICIFFNLIVFFLLFIGIVTFTKVTILYSSSDNINGTSAQLFWNATGDYSDYNEENSLTSVITNEKVSFGAFYIENEYLRYDPIDIDADISIDSISLTISGICFYEFPLKDCIGAYILCENVSTEDSSSIKLSLSNNDPQLLLTSNISKSEILYREIELFLKCIVIILCLNIIYEILILVMSTYQKDKRERINILIMVESIFTFVIISFSAIIFMIRNYIGENFSDLTYGQIIYHLRNPLIGTNYSTFYGVIIEGIICIVFSLLLCVIGIWLLKSNINRIVIITNYVVIAIVFICIEIGLLAKDVRFTEYWEYIHQSTTIFEDYYVDGKDISITFDDSKRNLIYIFLESMETTYSDKNSGGAMEDNYILELTQLAQDNVNFSSTNLLNGAYTVPGTTFTMGGIVAQTSGCFINETKIDNETLNGVWESENAYLPGLYTIGDLLEENGYVQEFIIGSVANFAGRRSYFQGHGNYNIFDIYTAKEKGYLSDDYWVWWGYEDQKLFEYAKDEILNMYETGNPFNCTLLTVDTHFTDGYMCDLCEDVYDQQYSNVIACSSKQVMDFVNWIQQQDFYDNTTIVLAGDHLTMDTGYINEVGADDFDRKTYFTIINPARECSNGDIDRTFTTMDIYPTVVASIGGNIEGNKLGLGINLFSKEQTLVEQMGLESLSEEVMKNSEYYDDYLLNIN